MSSLNYYLVENKLYKGGGYIPRTIINKVLTTDQLIERMTNKGTTLSRGEFENFFSMLKEVIEEVLKEGSGVNISNFVNIKPYVKGRFDTIDETFTQGKHSISINARIPKSFTNHLVHRIMIKKIKKPVVMPEITDVCENRLKENAVSRYYINTIYGDNFNCSSIIFKGLEIMDAQNNSNLAVFDIDALDVYQISNGQVTFIILADYEVPSWLTDQKEIYIRLLYENRGTALNVTSNHYKTKWNS